jgi:hypothetical protein
MLEIIAREGSDFKDSYQSLLNQLRGKLSIIASVLPILAQFVQDNVGYDEAVREGLQNRGSAARCVQVDDRTRVANDWGRLIT